MCSIEVRRHCAHELSVYRATITKMSKLLFLVAVVAAAQRPFPPPGMRCPERTLVIFDVVMENAGKAAALFDDHIAFLRSQMKAGTVVSGGPTADQQHGIILFAGSKWDEIEALLQKEPFTREGVMKIAGHHVWRACEVAP
jgi:hypothetical protein